MSGDRGPRPGDEVEITVRGYVVGIEDRDGCDGVRVAVSGMVNAPWRPVDAVVILDRAGEDGA